MSRADNWPAVIGSGEQERFLVSYFMGKERLFLKDAGHHSHLSISDRCERQKSASSCMFFSSHLDHRDNQIPEA